MDTLINIYYFQTLLSVFIIGVIELFLGTINFKFTQRNRIVCSSLSTVLHVYIWAYIISTLFEDKSYTFLLITSYALGCGLGDYFALKYDNILDKYITRIQRKGRKRKHGKFYGRKK